MFNQKNIFRSFLLISVCWLISRCNITEEYTIKEDGSGQFTMNIDMYKMIDMMQSFGKNDSSDENKMSKEKARDTVIYLRKQIDEAKELTAEQKRLFRDGSLDVVMNFEKKKFFFNINFPFKNQADLIKIYSTYPEALRYVDFKQAMGEDSSKGRMMGDADKMTMGNQYMELIAGNGFLERKIDPEKMKTYMEKDTTLKMMSPMMSGVYISTVIHLPRPVKKVENPYAQVSEDKKTVTFKFPFSDYTERPEVMKYRIEY